MGEDSAAPGDEYRCPVLCCRTLVIGGGDVLAQRATLIAACKTRDQRDGELVHPSLGRLNVSLLEFA